MHYQLADLRIDLAARSVHRADEVLPLHGLSFELFAYLLQQGDRVVGTDELIQAVWAPAIVNDETVTQRVKLLRQALGDDSRRPRYLRTVRGRGYQLCAPVSASDSSSASTLTAPAPPSPFRFLWPAMAILALLLVAAGWWSAQWRQPSEAHERAHGTPPASVLDTLLERARHYAEMGQRDDTLRAIDLYRQALALQPDLPDALIGLSFASSAMMCAHNDAVSRAMEAERLAQAVITHQPNNAQAYAARGYAADCRGLIESAMRDYARAYELDPTGRLDSLASLAHLQAIRGELATALAGNLRARAAGHDLRLVDLQLAHNLELLGYPAAAEQLLRRSYQLHPDSAFIAAAWPAFLFRQGRLEQARTALEQSRQRPQHPSLWLLAGELALVDGDRAAASAAFAEAAALKPGSGPAQSLRRIYADQLEPAWAAERLHQLAQAIAAGDRWPDNWLEMAQLHWALDDPQAALQALDQARQAGYRDRLSLSLSPLWEGLRRQEGYTRIVDEMASAVAIERERAQAVPGLAGLLAEGVR